jgi:hypothetical protein
LSMARAAKSMSRVGLRTFSAAKSTPPFNTKFAERSPAAVESQRYDRSSLFTFLPKKHSILVASHAQAHRTPRWAPFDMTGGRAKST